MSSSTLAADRLAMLVEPTLVAAVASSGVQPVGVGVDVVDLDVFERQLRVGGGRFLARVLVPAEIGYCNGRLEQLAARVAAKEAVVKALRCGFRGVGWQEIEIVTAANGAPSVQLRDRAAAKAAELGIECVHISLAHEGRLAIAIAIAAAHPISERREAIAGGDTR